LDTCLNKNDATNQVANGLAAGQYYAPTFGFIFPENVKPGDVLVPYDLWHLPFLRFGEGATTKSAIGPGVGPLEPTPWGGAAATVPDAPTIGDATAGNASASVSWTPPASAGGTPITGYTVTAVDAAGKPAGVPAVVGNVATGTVTGLTNGRTYQLEVAASNLVGAGPASGLSNAVTPVAAVPGAPTIGTATPGDGSALVTWTIPATDGGSAITGYLVEAVNAATKAPVGAPQTTVAGATSLEVTGLANGTSVQFQVQARNAIGAGAFSALSVAVTPLAPFTVPAAPVIGTPTSGNASALVRWTAAAIGGSPITGYSVRVVVGADLQVGALRPADAGATSLTVSGLANGTAVRFQVQARNAIGAGAYSDLSTAVTPATVPGAPVIGRASSGAARGVINATARWTPPGSNGGLAINGYVVTALRINARGTVVHTVTSAVRASTARSMTMGLPAGRYRFVIRARNAVGLGANSARSKLVTAR
ncbi:MAG: fibronectin type III domain-containing protein, partial [Marmoricola sp.]